MKSANRNDTAERLPLAAKRGTPRPSSKYDIGFQWLRQSTDGQSLVEAALFISVITVTVCYIVDFAYCFIAAASVTSAARNAAEYGIQGYSSASQGSLPSGGPISSTTSISGLAVADMSSLINASTATAVQVCTQPLGNPAPAAVCTKYGATGVPASFTPHADPEATAFGITRVDVVYMIKPPIPMSFFSVPIFPNPMYFHRMAEMRTMN